MQDNHVPLYYPTSDLFNRRVVYLTKEYTFDAAHKLCQHEGKCANLHGHTYKLLVTVSGYVNPPHDKSSRDLKHLMVTDFSTLGEMIKVNVLDTHDHAFLNDIYGDNPTAEVMCISIFDTLSRLLTSSDVTLESVKLYETPTSYAEYRRES